MSIVHGINASPFVRKVRIALKEKGIDYTLDPVIPLNVSAEYKKISPLGKVPVYTTDDGHHIPDSSVIIAYLERIKPQPALYPSNHVEFARALFLEEYADSVLANAAGTVFFQRIVAPRFLGQATEQAAVDKAIAEALPPLFAYLDSQIDGKKFFAGDSFSVADIGVVSPLINFAHAGEQVDAARYPSLAEFVARMLERTSIKELVAEEKASFQQAA